MDIETKHVFLSFFHAVKLAKYRGFYKADAHLKDIINEEDFLKNYQDNSVNEIFESLNDLMKFPMSKPKLIFIWIANEKLGIAIVNKIADDMKKSHIKTCIVITEKPPTPKARDQLKNLRSDSIYIDHFIFNSTLVFVPDHSLVPQHRICSHEEKQQILKSYCVQTNQLPQISHEDIMVKYLGAKKGNLLEILRRSETSDSEEYIPTYRIVV